MRTYMEGNTHVCELDGSADLRAVDKAPRTASAYLFESRKADGRDASWLGGTIADIDVALTHGWPEGLAIISELAASITEDLPQPKSVRRKQRWSEEGDEASWEREAAGYSDPWRTSVRETRRGPTIINLQASWGGNANLKARDLMWNGVALCVIIDVLERSGYRVNATLNHCTRIWSGNRTCLNRVTVKEASAPLDMASLAPIVAHPGAFRWYGINATSLAPFDVGYGHGSSIDLRAMPALEVLKGGYSLPLVYSKDAALRSIRTVLTDLCNSQ
jgi:hypothetical protein